jgi:sigma54-dependent transcription regulator
VRFYKQVIPSGITRTGKSIEARRKFESLKAFEMLDERETSVRALTQPRAKRGHSKLQRLPDHVGLAETCVQSSRRQILGQFD